MAGDAPPNREDVFEDGVALQPKSETFEAGA